MIKLREGHTIWVFPNWRVAHRNLDFCFDRQCTANRLERQCEMDLLFDDFGREIGRDCVLDFVELIEETRGEPIMKADEVLFENETNRAKMLGWYKRDVEMSISAGLDRASAERFAYQRTLRIFSDARDYVELAKTVTPESQW